MIMIVILSLSRPKKVSIFDKSQIEPAVARGTFITTWASQHYQLLITVSF